MNCTTWFSRALGLGVVLTLLASGAAGSYAQGQEKVKNQDAKSNIVTIDLSKLTPEAATQILALAKQTKKDVASKTAAGTVIDVSKLPPGLAKKAAGTTIDVSKLPPGIAKKVAPSQDTKKKDDKKEPAKKSDAQPKKIETKKPEDTIVDLSKLPPDAAKKILALVQEAKTPAISLTEAIAIAEKIGKGKATKAELKSGATGTFFKIEVTNKAGEIVKIDLNGAGKPAATATADKKQGEAKPAANKQGESKQGNNNQQGDNKQDESKQGNNNQQGDDNKADKKKDDSKTPEKKKGGISFAADAIFEVEVTGQVPNDQQRQNQQGNNQQGNNQQGMNNQQGDDKQDDDKKGEDKKGDKKKGDGKTPAKKKGDGKTPEKKKDGIA